MKLATLLTAAALVVAVPAFAQDNVVTITSAVPQDTPMEILMLFVNQTAPNATIEDFRMFNANDPFLSQVTMSSVLEKGTEYIQPIIPNS